eukprot:g11589.t1
MENENGDNYSARWSAMWDHSVLARLEEVVYSDGLVRLLRGVEKSGDRSVEEEEDRKRNEPSDPHLFGLLTLEVTVTLNAKKTRERDARVSEKDLDQTGISEEATKLLDDDGRTRPQLDEGALAAVFPAENTLSLDFSVDARLHFSGRRRLTTVDEVTATASAATDSTSESETEGPDFKLLSAGGNDADSVSEDSFTDTLEDEIRKVAPALVERMTTRGAAMSLESIETIEKELNDETNSVVKEPNLDVPGERRLSLLRDLLHTLSKFEGSATAQRAKIIAKMQEHFKTYARTLAELYVERVRPIYDVRRVVVQALFGQNDEKKGENPPPSDSRAGLLVKKRWDHPADFEAARTAIWRRLTTYEGLDPAQMLRDSPLCRRLEALKHVFEGHLSFFADFVAKYPTFLYVHLYLPRTTAWENRASITEDAQERGDKSILFEPADIRTILALAHQVTAKWATLQHGVRLLFEALHFFPDDHEELFSKREVKMFTTTACGDWWSPAAVAGTQLQLRALRARLNDFVSGDPQAETEDEVKEGSAAPVEPSAPAKKACHGGACKLEVSTPPKATPEEVKNHEGAGSRFYGDFGAFLDSLAEDLQSLDFVFDFLVGYADAKDALLAGMPDYDSNPDPEDYSRELALYHDLSTSSSSVKLVELSGGRGRGASEDYTTSSRTNPSAIGQAGNDTSGATAEEVARAPQILSPPPILIFNRFFLAPEVPVWGDVKVWHWENDGSAGGEGKTESDVEHTLVRRDLFELPLETGDSSRHDLRQVVFPPGVLVKPEHATAGASFARFSLPTGRLREVVKNPVSLVVEVDDLWLLPKAAATDRDHAPLLRCDTEAVVFVNNKTSVEKLETTLETTMNAVKTTSPDPCEPVFRTAGECSDFKSVLQKEHDPNTDTCFAAVECVPLSPAFFVLRILNLKLNVGFRYWQEFSRLWPVGKAVSRHAGLFGPALHRPGGLELTPANSQLSVDVALPFDEVARNWVRLNFIMPPRHVFEVEAPPHVGLHVDCDAVEMSRDDSKEVAKTNVATRLQQTLPHAMSQGVRTLFGTLARRVSDIDRELFQDHDFFDGGGCGDLYLRRHAVFRLQSVVEDARRLLEIVLGRLSYEEGQGTFPQGGRQGRDANNQRRSAPPLMNLLNDASSFVTSNEDGLSFDEDAAEFANELSFQVRDSLQFLGKMEKGFLWKCGRDVSADLPEKGELSAEVYLREKVRPALTSAEKQKEYAEKIHAVFAVSKFGDATGDYEWSCAGEYSALLPEYLVGDYEELQMEGGAFLERRERQASSMPFAYARGGVASWGGILGGLSANVQILKVEDGLQNVNVAAWGGISEGVPEGLSVEKLRIYLSEDGGSHSFARTLLFRAYQLSHGRRAVGQRILNVFLKTKVDEWGEKLFEIKLDQLRQAFSFDETEKTRYQNESDSGSARVARAVETSRAQAHPLRPERNTSIQPSAIEALTTNSSALTSRAAVLATARRIETEFAAASSHTFCGESQSQSDSEPPSVSDSASTFTSPPAPESSDLSSANGAEASTSSPALIREVYRIPELEDSFFLKMKLLNLRARLWKLARAAGRVSLDAEAAIRGKITALVNMFQIFQNRVLGDLESMQEAEQVDLHAYSVAALDTFLDLLLARVEGVLGSDRSSTSTSAAGFEDGGNQLQAYSAVRARGFILWESFDAAFNVFMGITRAFRGGGGEQRDEIIYDNVVGSTNSSITSTRHVYFDWAYMSKYLQTSSLFMWPGLLQKYAFRGGLLHWKGLLSWEIRDDIETSFATIMGKSAGDQVKTAFFEAGLVLLSKLPAQEREKALVALVEREETALDTFLNMAAQREIRLWRGFVYQYCAALAAGEKDKEREKLVEKIGDLNVVEDSRMEFDLQQIQKSAIHVPGAGSEVSFSSSPKRMTTTHAEKKRANFVKRLTRLLTKIHEAYRLPADFDEIIAAIGKRAENGAGGAEEGGDLSSSEANGDKSKNSKSKEDFTACGTKKLLAQETAVGRAEDEEEQPLTNWRPIAELSEKQLRDAAAKLGKRLNSLSSDSEVYDWEKNHFHVLMSLIMRCSEVSPGESPGARHFVPRDTQLIATVMFLDVFASQSRPSPQPGSVDGSADDDEDDVKADSTVADAIMGPPSRMGASSGNRAIQVSSLRGRLGQVETGEGKSYITAMLCAALALPNKYKVDFLTSTKILATDQQKEWAPFFDMMLGGTSASANNCDDEANDPKFGVEIRKQRYGTARVIYGVLGDFQRDFLLTEYAGRGIRSGLTRADYGRSVIAVVDENDNMMLDNAGKSLYLSHNVTDLRLLQDLFVRIWELVNEAGESESESHASGSDATLSWEDSERIDSVLSVLKVELLTGKLLSNLSAAVEHLGGFSPRNTGVEQASTQWSNGLHQFLQLKHAGRLTPISLKAFFSSNLSFFNMYGMIFGFSGTQGGSQEKSFMRSQYSADFFSVALPEGAKSWVEGVVEDLIFTLQPFVEEILGRKAQYKALDGNLQQRREFVLRRKQILEKSVKNMKQKKMKLEQNIKELLTKVNAWLKKRLQELMPGLVFDEKDNLISETDKDARNKLKQELDALAALPPAHESHSVFGDEKFGETRREFLANVVAAENNSESQTKYPIVSHVAVWFAEKPARRGSPRADSSHDPRRWYGVGDGAGAVTVSTSSSGGRAVSVSKAPASSSRSPLKTVARAEGASAWGAAYNELLAELAGSWTADGDGRHDWRTLLVVVDEARKTDSELKKAEERHGDTAGLHEKLSADGSLQLGKNKTALYVYPADAKPDLRRAGLVICETIEEAQLLKQVIEHHAELQQVLNSPNVYLYDRSYADKKANLPERLEPGTILIGTNIIGRGSDFAIDDALTLNGGIHVILQYLPSSERISTQAFGRTARGDKPGTGRYNFDWRRQSVAAELLTMRESVRMNGRSRSSTDHAELALSRKLDQISRAASAVAEGRHGYISFSPSLDTTELAHLVRNEKSQRQSSRTAPEVPSIAEILWRRDNAEFKRLVNVQQTEIPKLELEAKLFDLFTIEYATLKNLLEQKVHSLNPHTGLYTTLFNRCKDGAEAFVELQKHALLNHFSFWLHSVEERILNDDSMEELLGRGPRGGGSTSTSGDDRDGDDSAGFHQRLQQLDARLLTEFRDFVERLHTILEEKLSPRFSGNVYGFVEAAGAVDRMQVAHALGRCTGSGPTTTTTTASSGSTTAATSTSLAALIRGRILNDILDHFPEQSAVAAYELSLKEMQERKASDSFSSDHKRKWMKRHLYYVQETLDQNLEKAQTRLAQVRQLVLVRFRGAFSKLVREKVSVTHAENSTRLDPRSGAQSVDALAHAAQQEFERRANLLSRLWEKTAFVSQQQTEISALTFFREKVTSLAGRLNLQESAFEVGSFLLENGRAAKFVKEFAKKEKQLWGGFRFQYYRLARNLRPTYKILVDYGTSDTSGRDVLEERLQALWMHLSLTSKVMHCGETGRSTSQEEEQEVTRGMQVDVEEQKLIRHSRIVRLNVCYAVRAVMSQGEGERDELTRHNFLQLFAAPREFFVLEQLYENPYLGPGCDPHDDDPETAGQSASFFETNYRSDLAKEGCLFFAPDYIAFEKKGSLEKKIVAATSFGASASTNIYEANDALHTSKAMELFLDSAQLLIQYLIAFGILADPSMVKCRPLGRAAGARHLLQQDDSVSSLSESHIFTPSFFSYIHRDAAAGGTRDGCPIGYVHPGKDSKETTATHIIAPNTVASLFFDNRKLVQAFEKKLFKYHILKSRAEQDHAGIIVSKDAAFSASSSGPQSNTIVDHPLAVHETDLEKLAGGVGDTPGLGSEPEGGGTFGVEQALVTENVLEREQSVLVPNGIKQAVRGSLSEIRVEEVFAEWLLRRLRKVDEVHRKNITAETFKLLGKRIPSRAGKNKFLAAVDVPAAILNAMDMPHKECKKDVEVDFILLQKWFFPELRANLKRFLIAHEGRAMSRTNFAKNFTTEVLIDERFSFNTPFKDTWTHNRCLYMKIFRPSMTKAKVIRRGRMKIRRLLHKEELSSEETRGDFEKALLQHLQYYRPARLPAGNTTRVALLKRDVADLARLAKEKPDDLAYGIRVAMPTFAAVVDSTSGRTSSSVSSLNWVIESTTTNLPLRRLLTEEFPAVLEALSKDEVHLSEVKSPPETRGKKCPSYCDAALALISVASLTANGNGATSDLEGTLESRAYIVDGLRSALSETLVLTSTDIDRLRVHQDAVVATLDGVLARQRAKLSRRPPSSATGENAFVKEVADQVQASTNPTPEAEQTHPDNIIWNDVDADRFFAEVTADSLFARIEFLFHKVWSEMLHAARDAGSPMRLPRVVVLSVDDVFQRGKFSLDWSRSSFATQQEHTTVDILPHWGRSYRERLLQKQIMEELTQVLLHHGIGAHTSVLQLLKPNAIKNVFAEQGPQPTLQRGLLRHRFCRDLEVAVTDVQVARGEQGQLSSSSPSPMLFRTLELEVHSPHEIKAKSLLVSEFFRKLAKRTFIFAVLYMTITSFAAIATEVTTQFFAQQSKAAALDAKLESERRRTGRQSELRVSSSGELSAEKEKWGIDTKNFRRRVVVGLGAELTDVAGVGLSADDRVSLDHVLGLADDEGRPTEGDTGRGPSTSTQDFTRARGMGILKLQTSLVFQYLHEQNILAPLRAKYVSDNYQWDYATAEETHDRVEEIKQLVEDSVTTVDPSLKRKLPKSLKFWLKAVMPLVKDLFAEDDHKDSQLEEMVDKITETLKQDIGTLKLETNLVLKGSDSTKRRIGSLPDGSLLPGLTPPVAEYLSENLQLKAFFELESSLYLVHASRIAAMGVGQILFSLMPCLDDTYLGNVLREEGRADLSTALNAFSGAGPRPSMKRLFLDTKLPRIAGTLSDDAVSWGVSAVGKTGAAESDRKGKEQQQERQLAGENEKDRQREFEVEKMKDHQLKLGQFGLRAGRFGVIAMQVAVTSAKEFAQTKITESLTGLDTVKDGVHSFHQTLLSDPSYVAVKNRVKTQILDLLSELGGENDPSQSLPVVRKIVDTRYERDLLTVAQNSDLERRTTKFAIQIQEWHHKQQQKLGNTHNYYNGFTPKKPKIGATRFLDFLQETRGLLELGRELGLVLVELLDAERVREDFGLAGAGGFTARRGDSQVMSSSDVEAVEQQASELANRLDDFLLQQVSGFVKDKVGFVVNRMVDYVAEHSVEKLLKNFEVDLSDRLKHLMRESDKRRERKNRQKATRDKDKEHKKKRDAQEREDAGESAATFESWSTDPKNKGRQIMAVRKDGSYGHADAAALRSHWHGCGHVVDRPPPVFVTPTHGEVVNSFGDSAKAPFGGETGKMVAADMLWQNAGKKGRAPDFEHIPVPGDPSKTVMYIPGLVDRSGKQLFLLAEESGEADKLGHIYPVHVSMDKDTNAITKLEKPADYEDNIGKVNSDGSPCEKCFPNSLLYVMNQSAAGANHTGKKLTEAQLPELLKKAAANGRLSEEFYSRRIQCQDCSNARGCYGSGKRARQNQSSESPSENADAGPQMNGRGGLGAADEGSLPASKRQKGGPAPDSQPESNSWGHNHENFGSGDGARIGARAAANGKEGGRKEPQPKPQDGQSKRDLATKEARRDVVTNPKEPNANPEPQEPKNPKKEAQAKKKKEKKDAEALAKSGSKNRDTSMKNKRKRQLGAQAQAAVNPDVIKDNEKGAPKKPNPKKVDPFAEVRKDHKKSHHDQAGTGIPRQAKRENNANFPVRALVVPADEDGAAAQDGAHDRGRAPRGLDPNFTGKKVRVPSPQYGLINNDTDISDSDSESEVSIPDLARDVLKIGDKRAAARTAQSLQNVGQRAAELDAQTLPQLTALSGLGDYGYYRNGTERALGIPALDLDDDPLLVPSDDGRFKQGNVLNRHVRGRIADTKSILFLMVAFAQGGWLPVPNTHACSTPAGPGTNANFGAVAGVGNVIDMNADTDKCPNVHMAHRVASEVRFMKPADSDKGTPATQMDPVLSDTFAALFSRTSALPKEANLGGDRALDKFQVHMLNWFGSGDGLKVARNIEEIVQSGKSDYKINVKEEGQECGGVAKVFALTARRLTRTANRCAA